MSTNSVYIITSINPKDGVLQEIHEEMLYRKAHIIEANCGDAGLLKVLPPYDDRYHTFGHLLLSDVLPGVMNQIPS